MKNWEKKWEDFVLKEMIPNRCGHLRFKLKKLITTTLDQREKEYEKGIDDIWKLHQIEKKELAESMRLEEKTTFLKKQIKFGEGKVEDLINDGCLVDGYNLAVKEIDKKIKEIKK